MCSTSWPSVRLFRQDRAMTESVKITGFAAGPYQTNCYALIDVNTAQGVVIDPGLGAATKIQELFAQHSATLTAVLLTHGHIDHVRDAGELGVDVYIHESDQFMLEPRTIAPRHSGMLFDAAAMKVPNRITYLRDGQTISSAGVALTVRHAPGHSPGSVLLVADTFVFTGDVLFRGSIGRTDLEYADPEAMAVTLRGPVWELEDTLAILPGHGPTSTVKHERATNPFLREISAQR